MINKQKANSVKSIQEYILLAETYRKEENYKKLLILADKMTLCFPNVFVSYMYKAIAETETDLSSSRSIDPFIINKNQIEIDMKSRFYFEAREKYKTADKKVIDSLKKHYPNDCSVEAHVSRKRTDYHKMFDKVSNLIESAKENKELLTTRLSELAKTDEERTVLFNYLKWWDVINYSYSELIRYDHEANNFVIEDAKKTDNSGNILLSIFHGLLLVVSGVTCILSVLSLIFLLANNLVAINLTPFVSAIFISLLLLFLSSFGIKKVLKLRKMPTVLIIFIILAIIAYGAAGVSLSYVSYVEQSSNAFSLIFIVIGLVASICLFMISISKLIKVLPKSKKGSDTILSDLKALMNNDFAINFPFTYKTFKKVKLKKANIHINEYN